MIAKDLISYYLPSASCENNAGDIIAMMEEHHCSHMALVDNKTYHGIISENELLDIEDSIKAIKEVKANLARPFVTVYQHIYDVIQIAADFNLSVIPVLDDKENYLGVIGTMELTKAFADIINVGIPGGIVVLEMNTRDYSLAQVAQIVESDNGKILSSYVSNSQDSLKIDLILKINKTDLSGILSAFNRYNYVVKASYHESKHAEDLQRRFDQFMNYLNM